MGTRTDTALAKWGNSTGIRISKAVAKQADLHEGDRVRLEVEGPGVIVLRATKTQPSLESLLSRITAKNRHGEANWGRTTGKEVW